MKNVPPTPNRSLCVSHMHTSQYKNALAEQKKYDQKKIYIKEKSCTCLPIKKNTCTQKVIRGQMMHKALQELDLTLVAALNLGLWNLPISVSLGSFIIELTKLGIRLAKNIITLCLYPWWTIVPNFLYICEAHHLPIQPSHSTLPVKLSLLLPLWSLYSDFKIHSELESQLEMAFAFLKNKHQSLLSASIVTIF